MHSHIRLVATTDTTTVVAVDGPTHGNACHVYEVRTNYAASWESGVTTINLPKWARSK